MEAQRDTGSEQQSENLGPVRRHLVRRHRCPRVAGVGRLQRCTVDSFIGGRHRAREQGHSRTHAGSGWPWRPHHLIYPGSSGLLCRTFPPRTYACMYALLAASKQSPPPAAIGLAQATRHLADGPTFVRDCTVLIGSRCRLVSVTCVECDACAVATGALPTRTIPWFTADHGASGLRSHCGAWLSTGHVGAGDVHSAAWIPDVASRGGAAHAGEGPHTTSPPSAPWRWNTAWW